MTPTSSEIAATALFAVAILHTFSVKRLQHWAHALPHGSIGANFFHLLGEVEIAFGLWAGVLVLYLTLFIDARAPIEYLESRNFTEPAFVFVIMTIAATRPIIQLAGDMIALFAKLITRVLPLNAEVAFYFSALTLGPLLGSFITEPAAMTVTALILKERVFDRGIDRRAMYLTLGTLFVNVSIGGVLTHFAAPPVLMVAETWRWGTDYMLTHFGWRAALAVMLNAGLATAFVAKGLARLKASGETSFDTERKWWLITLHVSFLALVVLNAHHAVVFMGLFLFFLGVNAVTQEHQEPLKLRESLLVAFFLGGLVVLGGLQEWWLAPLIRSLDAQALFLGATALTAITDNAALTYLGAQVPNISESFKYALVAGAVTGGGLTVIANAPNPAGFAILRESFGDEGISPLGLFAAAVIPTIIAAMFFWIDQLL